MARIQRRKPKGKQKPQVVKLGLSEEALAWRAKIVAAFEIDDAAGDLLLDQAMEALDRLRGAQQLIAEEGLVGHDRYGRLRANPALAVERDARTALMRALRSLNLDVEPPTPKGKPWGR